MKRIILSLLLFTSMACAAQTTFSIATDVSFMRNLSPKQQFSAVGQTIQANFHYSPRETGYAWLNYHSPGNFSNDYTALARSGTTTPATIRYTAKSRWVGKQLSLGWQHYFKGAYNLEYGYSIFGRAGFGLAFTKVENGFTPAVDTSVYRIVEGPSQNSGDFRRLTFDLGLGAEVPLGGNFFAYGEARAWLPASRGASALLHAEDRVPFQIMLNLGLRILFDLGY